MSLENGMCSHVMLCEASYRADNSINIIVVWRHGFKHMKDVCVVIVCFIITLLIFVIVLFKSLFLTSQKLVNVTCS